MSRKPLTEHQISLLIKGPKFCQSTKGNYLNIKADIKEYTRKLKLKDAFHGQVFEGESLVRKKSNYTPKTKNQDLTKIIDIIEKVNQYLRQIVIISYSKRAKGIIRTEER